MVQHITGDAILLLALAHAHAHAHAPVGSVNARPPVFPGAERAEVRELRAVVNDARAGGRRVKVIWGAPSSGSSEAADAGMSVLATATVRVAQNTTGWNAISLKTVGGAAAEGGRTALDARTAAAETRFFAMGLLEGTALAEAIVNHGLNLADEAYHLHNGGAAVVPLPFVQFMKNTTGYWEDTAAAGASRFAVALRLLNAQNAGVLEGLRRAVLESGAHDDARPDATGNTIYTQLVNDVTFTRLVASMEGVAWPGACRWCDDAPQTATARDDADDRGITDAAIARGLRLLFWLVQFHIDAGELQEGLGLKRFQSAYEARVSADVRAARFHKASTQSRCSALIKLMRDRSTGTRRDDDIYVSHNTWALYAEMTRVYRDVDARSVAEGLIAAGEPLIKNPRIFYPSYPGAIGSMDDLYTLPDQNMVVLETTLHCMDCTDRLQKYVTPASVVTPMRAMVANLIAGDGAEWVAAFAQQNSGSQNNQWMVVDYKKLDEATRAHGDGSGDSPGLLWVLEQMPGFVHYEDMSATLLSTGYWASFNNPYFPATRAVSKFDAYAKDATIGFFFSHELTPRNRLFERDHGKVVDEASLRGLMRSNNYTADPLSGGCPRYAIASRYELPGTESCVWWANLTGLELYEGAYDVKYVTRDLVAGGGTVAVSGPVWGAATGGIAAFDWRRAYRPEAGGRVPAHRGMPDVWDFPWYTMTAAWAGSRMP